MERNKSIDIIRAASILLIVVYHCYAVTGAELTNYLMIDTFIGYGGEIGVTMFFILSGFGIYSLMDNNRIKGIQQRYKEFLKKRAVRILPQYYVSLLVMLLLTEAAGLLSFGNAKHVITHGLFIHNFWVVTHGSINGVLWTMGVIVQFYFIAYWIYKLVHKHDILIIIASVIFTVICKWIVFRHILYPLQKEGTYYFVYGRQLITAFDNFIVGMFVAKRLREHPNQWGKLKNLLITVGMFFLLLGWIQVGKNNNIYSANRIGYIWHTVTALILGMGMYFFGNVMFSEKAYVNRMFQFISKYEYGIYLWHLVIIYNVLKHSNVFQSLINYSFALFSLVIILLSILSAIVSARVDGLIKVGKPRVSSNS